MIFVQMEVKALYKLIGPDGKSYLSEEKGEFGGHRGLKIYGRLDCRSALQAIARPTGGTYIKNRVFFKDEATAIAAGYRRCHICMREHYDLWRAGRLMEIFSENFSENP